MSFWQQLGEMVLEFLLPNRASSKQLAKLTVSTFVEQVGAPKDQTLADITLFPYRQPLAKAVIWELKYHQSKVATQLIAELLSETINSYLEDTWPLGAPHEIIFVPIPLSRNREQQRGYNQVSLVLDYLPESEFKTVKEVLIRERDTDSQTAKANKQERQKNVNGCFKATKPEIFSNKIVFLVDDVVTTGSTLAEAKKVLLVAGAKEVITVAFAH